MPTLKFMMDTGLYAAGIAPPIAPAPPPGNAMPMGKSKPPVSNNQKNQAGGKTTKGTTSKSQGSPMAQHIANHMQDPLGATKEAFENLSQKKLEYDQAKEGTQRELQPVQGVINHLSQIHGIMPGAPAGQSPTPGMTPAAPQIDPATGLPMQGQPGQDPNNPGGNDNPDMDPMTGNPANMAQTPGQINQNRPSMAGHQPGVSPGPSENVRPGKMGMPQPGGLPQNNKQAAKPKGAGSLPGAKGPGDPKVSNRTKKAQGNSSRQVKISVAASTPRNRTITTQFGLAVLAAGTSTGAKKHWSVRNKGPLSKKEKDAHYKTMDSAVMRAPGSPGSGMRSPAKINTGVNDGGRTTMPGMDRMLSKRMKAGPAQLEDKVSDSGAQLSYNPTGGTMAPKLNAGKHMKGCGCSKCQGMQAGGPGSGRHKTIGSYKMPMHDYKIFKKNNPSWSDKKIVSFHKSMANKDLNRSKDSEEAFLLGNY